MTIAAMERGRRSRGAAAIGAALLLFLAAASLGAHANTDSNDVTALGVFYTTMNSPPQLKNWVPQNGDPCGQLWNGITCTGSRVTTINLSGMSLNGTLGYNMNLLTALVQLDMSNNNLGGSDIPYNLPPNLEKLNLAGNHFTGTTPYSISQMISLKELNLGHNQISTISDMFNQMTNLTTMDISFNTFSGNIPQSFNSLTSLKTLYMQNNQFSGTIDVLANLPLTDLNVANNQFTGWVPDKLKKINNLQTTGNSFSNGPAPPPPPGTTPTPTPQRTAPPSRNASNGSSDSGSQHSKLQGGAIAGIVICLLVVGAMVTFFVIKRKSWKFSVRRDPEQNEPLSPLASGFKQIKSIKIISTTGKDQFQKTVSMSLKPPTKIDLHKSFDDNDLTSKSITRKISLSSIRILNLVGDQGKPLSWNSRVKIALGYETCSPSVIHKNFKSSNILLDIELNPHLSDSGYADLIPNQEFQESEENLGYRAPEVTMCGQYSLKSDVYSFGVVMLELLTGRKPFDRSRSRSEQSLVRWATPQLHDIDALDQMVDPALQGLYPSKSLSRFADAIALCVQAEPEFRPPMSEVVQSLVRLVQRANMTRMASSCESYTGRHGESGDYAV